MSGYVLAIDQGTTSTRAIVFDSEYRNVGSGQQEFPQHFPQSGWVEHDAEDLWRTVVETSRTALTSAGVSSRDVAAIGITNQRETVVMWDRRTGTPISRAIVWQDRRTAEHCARLRADGAEQDISRRTGLLLDPYFSATKIAWLLQHVPGAREAAQAGHLAFGTVDSWLVYKLTGGRRHLIDITNASRTMLCNIETAAWDDSLLSLFGIPRAILPEIVANTGDFGETDEALFGGRIAIKGIAGDQQAAMIGQACFEPGMVKSTYGTGCFTLLNIGEEPVVSQHRLLTTIAYWIDGRMHYALEGSIFVAGAAVQWLRDGLGVIDRADRSGTLAGAADARQSVYLVPAFTGLGAPWWDPDARGALYGLTRNTGPAELAKAALESVCFQTRDLLRAMRRDWPKASETFLRVDGGMAASDWTMQRLADILDVPVDRPVVNETTALGAAWLAGHGAGVWPDMQGFSQSWKRDRTFTPRMNEVDRQTLVLGWRAAVKSTLDFGAKQR
ncbi:glycerol kinase GlpK [Sinorhizobium sp. BG8]|uniref:glycerol kinase GlpK n=1 Tax=Sinorhizobium sp. BG8 TaxID=2613773 RepID=UPI00193DBFB1|nr:glycerol kinase GlpK [Sinorhizobium sp. BG8]QRM57108.1 glycerol kinase GlpK [Sinorhizobium sp. BG8]